MMHSITGKVLIGIAIFLAFLAFMAVQAMHGIGRMSGALSHLSDTLLPQAAVNEQIEIHLARAISDLRRVIHDRSPDAIQVARDQLTQAQTEIDKLEQMTSGESDPLFVALNERRRLLIGQITDLLTDATLAISDHSRPIPTDQGDMLEQIEADFEALSSQRNEWMVQAENARIEEVKVPVGVARVAAPIAYSVLGLLTILLIWLLHRQIVRPVRILAAEAKAIGDGQLDLPIDTTGIDEIGQLQRALQQMAMDLRDREQVLLERTTQLIEHQRLKLELTRQRDVADAASQAKSAFLAVMSHELRTPLTAIMGYSQLLEHMIAIGDYSTAASDLRRISGAGQHLLSLVNDVLDLAQIEAGRLRISAERVDVPTLINSVTETVEPLVTQKQNTLRVTCPAQMPPLFTDPLKLRQALLNLLSNAAKFTNAGQIDLRVSEEQIDGHPWIAFVVADTGIGIPRNQMDKLFKPFSQVNDRAARRYGGTGLGLSLSRRLCQLLGGDISVESFFGVGSVFTIRLPVSAPTNPPAAITARPSITSAATPSS